MIDVARLFVGNEVIDDWHPLDGLPPPDFVPSEWNGPHVQHRLSDAWKTLQKMPGVEFGPQTFGQWWPEYRIEWEDLLAMVSQDGGVDAVTALYRQLNSRAKIYPSAKEITQMESAIHWPIKYLLERFGSRWVSIVNVCARCHALGRDLHREIRKRKYTGNADQWREINRKACQVIANGLHDDKVTVF